MDPSQIEYMVVEFPVEQRADVLVPQLQALVQRRAIDILDLAFIRKDKHGTVRVVELEALDEQEAGAFADLEGDILGLLSDEDLDLVGEQLPSDSAAAVLVWENTATRALKGVVADAGGSIVAHEHVPTHIVRKDLAALGR